MAKEERTPKVAQVKLGGFPGLMTNADPHDVPPGAAQVQTNFQSLIPGQLTVRKGVQPSTDFTPSSPSTNDLIAIAGYVRPEGNVVLIQDNAGNLKAFRSAAATTLASSLATTHPGTFAKHRRGHAVFVNGRDRGSIWNGTSAAAWELGVDYPVAAHTFAATTGGAATAGDYIATYRYVDCDKPKGNPSSIAPLSTVTATANQSFTHNAFVQSTQTRVTSAGGRIEIWRSTVDEANILYLIATLGHNGTITSGATNGGFIRFTLPAGHGLITGAKILVAGTDVGGYNTTHTVTAYTSTTVTTSVSYSSDSTGGTWTLTGFTADTSSDETLQTAAENDASTRLIIVSGTEIVARRFTVPPNYKRVAVQFQDRMLYAVDDLYDTGTIATTAGSTTVTGTGTAWVSTMAGRYIYCKDIPEPLIISSVGSATSITTTLPVSAAVSGKAYGIRPRPDVRNAVIYSEIDEPESVPTESDGTIDNIITIQENTGDDDEITGLIPFGAVCYVGKERHIYTLTFFNQPKLDASVSLLAQRGLLNQRCWAFHEGQCFVLDRQGPYILSVGGDITDIAEPIRNRFRDTTINWANGKWFHVKVDPIFEKVYFFVCNTGDTGTRPRRALVYGIRSKSWWDETFVSDMGDSCNLPISNSVRLLFAGENDRIYLANEGTTDGVTAQYLATITTGSASTTLTASGATFTSAMVEAPFYIYEGTGKGTGGRITGQTGTTLTIESAITVDTTTKIKVGGIYAAYRSGILELAGTEYQNERSIEITFLPTSGSVQIDVRRYFNHDTSPENNAMDDNGRGTSVTRAVGSPDDVMTLDSSRITGTVAAGWGRTTFSGRVADQMEGKRWFTTEVRTVAGDYAPLIYQITINGATHGSD